MSFPTSATSLVPIRQDSDGTCVEPYTIPSSGPYTHRLGSSLTPALPSGWQLIVKGAFPISPPAAPTGVGSTETGGLATSGVYSWVLTSVTQYGETTPSAALQLTLTGGQTSATLTLPSVTEGTTDAPVVRRRLYRTTNGGSTYKYIADLPDLAQTTYIDKMPDTDLGVAVPGTNTSGIPQVLTLSGAATTWTEKAPGSTLSSGGYTVDYGYGPTGGTVTHAAADAGKSVTATYSAATLISSALENSLIAAISDIANAAGQPSGLPTLDANTRVVQPALHGVRQFGRSVLGGGDITFSNSFQSNSTNVANWQSLSPAISLTNLNNSTVIVFVSANVSTNSAGGNWLRLGTYFSGAGQTLVAQLMAHTEAVPGYNGSTTAVGNLAGFTIFTGLSGTISFPLLAQAGGGAGQNVSCKQFSNPGAESITFFAVEIG